MRSPRWTRRRFSSLAIGRRVRRPRTRSGRRAETSGSRCSSPTCPRRPRSEAGRGVGRDHDRLDVLVNCASAFFRTRRVSIDGLELTFALNLLAYFLLTNLMLEQLKRSGSARILNITAPATTRIDFDDLQAEHRYRAFQVFGASKTAELMFTFELARRLEGTGITVNAVHPELVRTDLMHEAPAPFRFVLRLRGRSPDEAGARSHTWRRHPTTRSRPDGSCGEGRRSNHPRSRPTRRLSAGSGSSARSSPAGTVTGTVHSGRGPPRRRGTWSTILTIPPRDHRATILSART